MDLGTHPSHPLAGEVSFGPFTFDPERLRLSRHGRALPLQTQPARALRALLAARGAVVRRKALQTAVWGERHVDPELGLNQCIRRIRTALDDRAGSPLYVETVRGEGYRFVAPIVSRPSFAQPTFAQPTFEEPSSITDRVGVEELEPVRLSRRSSRRWPMAAAAVALAVLVAGTTFLLGAWGPSSARSAEVASPPLEREVPEETDASRPSGMPSAAWQAFLTARQARLAGQPEDPEVSVERLQRAVALYPSFAPAWVELAKAEQRRDLSCEVRFERSGQALERALRADPELAEAHLLRADHDFFWEWDWARAQEHYEAAVRFAPDRADAHKGLAFWLSNRGRFHEAVAHVEEAIRLDPVAVRLEADLGFFLMRAGRYQEALEPCRRAIDLDPEGYSGHACLMEASALVGASHAPPIDSVESLMRLFDADEEAIEEILLGDEATVYQRYWRWTLAGQLRNAEAGRAQPITLARIYAQLGRRDEAVHWLLQAEEERSTFIPFVGIDPWLRQLVGQPEYDRLLERLDLL